MAVVIEPDDQRSGGKIAYALRVLGEKHDEQAHSREAHIDQPEQPTHEKIAQTGRRSVLLHHPYAHYHLAYALPMVEHFHEKRVKKGRQIERSEERRVGKE